MSNTFLLDPKVDFVFKNLFMFESKSNILNSFINSFIKDRVIVESTIKNNEIEKHFLDDKFSTLEIDCLTNSNEKITVEIKLDNGYNLIKRSVYSLSKLYESQVIERENCSTLNSVIAINILNDSYIENDRFHNMYRLKEIDTNEELSNVLEIHFIEINKVSNTSENTLAHAWIEFLRNPQGLETIENISQYEEISIASDILNKLSNDLKQREFYELREKMIQDKLVALNTVEKKALEKGIEEGLEKGIEEGLERGRLKEKIDIAKNLLDVLDDWTISQKTGLEINLIKDMRK
ncbi:MAG: Rpn family recombination-promoting nuclease/putative transposase [Clostridium sp.]|uniref:Rpn family recombination-promoting nuclease/putative transposase n=1 Tax=Clostridium sp. TaxID=1506 RepID=UPI003F3A9F5F